MIAGGFTSLKPIFSKAQSAVPRQSPGPLLRKCAPQPVLPVAPNVGIPWTNDDAIREAPSVPCEIQDGDYTKETKPLCPDVF